MGIVINIVGDIATSHFENEKISFCPQAKRIISSAHLNIGNLENPVISKKEQKKKPKPIVLKSNSIPNEILSDFDVFSLANNHIFDFYDEGFVQTKEYLIGEQKKYFGAGNNIEEAITPLEEIIEGKKIVLWGCTRFDNAGKNKPGTAADTFSFYKNQILKYKQEGAFVIFYLHWGREYVDYPTPDDRIFAKKLIDTGVDCVLGNHPHVPQGAEVYKGKFIFYSLGNFIFSSKIAYNVAFDKNDKRLNLGHVVQLNINNDLSYQPKILPYKTHNGVVTILEGREFDDYQKHIKKISLITADDKKHLDNFYLSAAEIRTQSKRMIKKQMSEGGILSLVDPIRNVRLQDLRIAFYPNLEKKISALKNDNFLSKAYSVFVHKFLTFSVIGVLVTLTTMITLGVLLGLVKLPLFPTWWIVYLSAILLSLFLNNKLVFKGEITPKKVVLFSIVYLSSMFLGIYLLKFFRIITDLPNWLLGYAALPFTLTYNFFFVNWILGRRQVKSHKEENLEKLLDSLFEQ